MTTNQAPHPRSAPMVGKCWLSPQAVLVMVALAYLLAQVLLTGDVALGWDESIYASQSDPARPALPFTAPRARGTSWLAAPVQALTGSLTVLRIWFALLSATSLYAAFSVWRALWPGYAVPVAATGFAGLWTAIFYGPSLMPNVLVALAGVFATGALLSAAHTQHRRLGWASGGAVAAATIIRPGDTVPLVVALCTAVLVHKPWRTQAGHLLIPVVAGAAAGALPWIIEAQLRYGGTLLRVRRALASQSTGERFVPDYQLRAVDGPLLCRPCNRASQPIPSLGAVLWVVGTALVILAVVLAVRGLVAHGTAILLAAFSGAAQAAPYLFLVGYAAPRFLLPAYALLALPAAAGLLWLAAPRGRMRRSMAAALVALLSAHVAVQTHWLGGIIDGQELGRQRWAAVAAVLATHGVTPPCTLLGAEAPPVAYVAHCDSVRVSRPGDERFTEADMAQRIRTQQTAVVLRRSEKVPSFAVSWTAVPRRELPTGWRVLIGPRPARRNVGARHRGPEFRPPVAPADVGASR